MSMIRQAAAGSVAAFMLALSAGCATTPSVPDSPTSPSMIPATPSPTPTLSSDEKAAGEVVIAFYRALNRVASDPNVPLDTLYNVAGGELVAERLKIYQQSRAAKRRQLGEAVPKIREVSGTSPFTVVACVDTTGLDVVDEHGNSVVPTGNPTLVLHRFTIDRVGDLLVAVKDEVVSTPC